MIGIRRFRGIMMAFVIGCVSASPSHSDDAVPTTPFQAHVDMKTFMEHVLSPAAAIIWKVNAVVIDAKGEQICRPNPTTTGSRSSAARRRWRRPPTR
jgi:hypothetical protein